MNKNLHYGLIDYLLGNCHNVREHRPPELAERNHEERGMFEIAYLGARPGEDTQRMIPAPVDGDSNSTSIVEEFRAERAIRTSCTIGAALI
ncbi:hypothetical protein [Nocardia sp. BMG51109]|uniref:hypothetical protein n=1 Tax=Nocardia sp. BMG51109 TaxID=1056816 RepID=UPI0018DE0A71|nr:hypothetical protein [Nocardia sp. BMG51109]